MTETTEIACGYKEMSLEKIVSLKETTFKHGFHEGAVISLSSDGNRGKILSCWGQFSLHGCPAELWVPHS